MLTTKPSRVYNQHFFFFTTNEEVELSKLKLFVQAQKIRNLGLSGPKLGSFYYITFLPNPTALEWIHIIKNPQLIKIYWINAYEAAGDDKFLHSVWLFTFWPPEQEANHLQEEKHQQIMQHENRWKEKKGQMKWAVGWAAIVALDVMRWHWIEYFIHSGGWGLKKLGMGQAHKDRNLSYVLSSWSSVTSSSFKPQSLCHHFGEAFSDLGTCDRSWPPMCHPCCSQIPLTLIK